MTVVVIHYRLLVFLARRLRFTMFSSPAITIAHPLVCLRGISMANPMIATAPTNSRAASPRLEFEHLVLGDLRELLNDEPGRERDRWLLATLDMLLVSRPRRSLVYLPVIPRDADWVAGASNPSELPLPFERLQRLRDRIAHRAPYEALAQELIVDLRLYFDGLRVQRETLLPIAS